MVTSFITEAGLTGTLRPVRQPGRRACTALRIGHQHAQGFARQLGAGQGNVHLRRQGRRTGRLKAAHWRASPRTAHSQPTDPTQARTRGRGMTGKPPFRKEPKVRWGKNPETEKFHIPESLGISARAP